jgi:uncharacterized protein (DUF885 family)
MRSWLKLLATGIAACIATLAQAAEPAWITESNRHSQTLLDVMARYNPEAASFFGVEGHDGEVFDLKPRFAERQEADLQAAITKLQAVRASATDPRVRQDVDILISAAGDQRTTSELNRRLMLPYFDLPQAIFQGFQNLLDERIPQERQKFALQRLERYAGTASGYEPITALAHARFEERLSDASLTGPWVDEVNENLDNQKRYVAGTRELFAKSKLKGWEGALKKLEAQLADHEKWVRSTVIPRARKTNRLPPEIYADNLKNFGVPMQPRELIDRAQAGYLQTRDEMDTLARLVASQRGWKENGYRDVMRQLKKERFPSDKVLDTYRKRLADIEEITRREKLVTLPTRPAVIRLATEAESAAQPAPHVDPPRLIGNTGEPAEFVLPMSNPTSQSGAEMDDFIYDAITWTLTAHEARPGHELQFAKMLERGVSTARVVFAFNSANVEGWALYAEAVVKQYLPLEGQMGSLQMRLMRAARAFLDPMLNLGMIEPEAAKRFLMEEVMLSEPMAKQEVDRYTFRAPGQATAYFYGYSKLEALRTRAELALRGKLDVQAYHDFIVDQGLLPLDLLDKAVMEDFVAASHSPRN